MCYSWVHTRCSVNKGMADSSQWFDIGGTARKWVLLHNRHITSRMLMV